MGLIICNGAIPILKVLILLFFCFLSKFSIATDRITTAQPITGRDRIISSNNAFQLGFFSPINTNNRYVGIWYSNDPSETAVWVANRDRPLNDSSGTMIVSNDGNLLILNEQKQIIWSSNVSNPVANSSAQLLDSGNLVIQDDSNGRTRRLWESFQHPSDSFLQKMKLGNDASVNVTTVLKSWKSSSDPSVGIFSGSMSSLTTIPEFYIWNGSHPYLRLGPWNSQIFIGIQNMKNRYLDGLIVVPDNKGSGYVMFTLANESLQLYFFINHDGTLMRKDMIERKRKWEVSWSFPETNCDLYGKCGPFGSCNSKDSPICSCLRGFEPNNIEEWNRENFTSGCVRRTPLQCERNGSSNPEKEDGFLKLKTMKVPALPDRASAQEIECENLCLRNCSCTAYAYDQGIGCMSWSRSLIDIQKFSSNGADLYIRVAYSELGNIFLFSNP